MIGSLPKKIVVLRHRILAERALLSFAIHPALLVHLILLQPMQKRPGCKTISCSRWKICSNNSWARLRPATRIVPIASLPTSLRITQWHLPSLHQMWSRGPGWQNPSIFKVPRLFSHGCQCLLQTQITSQVSFVSSKFLINSKSYRENMGKRGKKLRFFTDSLGSAHDDFSDLQWGSNPSPNVTNVACTGPKQAIEMLQRFSLGRKPLLRDLLFCAF